jgi:D-alanyl-D-alanine carboxypeptidase
MYDFIQTALTATIEAIALVAFVGLPAHYIITSHVREVKSWGSPHTTPEPHVEVESEIKSPEAQTITEVAPSVKVVEQVVKSRKTRSEKALQPKLQPMSVGAAVVDYSAMTSEQLRKECALQGIEWRNSGDYGNPMKKAQMLAALR